jgi:uncharacterized phage protein (TIGR02218 family)
MKTISAELEAHYASGATTLATLWKLTRRDGTIFGFTDHDKPITFETQLYSPTSSYDTSAVSTKDDLSVANIEATGLLNATGITAAGLEAGTWDGTRTEVREVNFKDLTMGANLLPFGEIGEIQRKGRKFQIEIRGLTNKLQNNIGRIYVDQCDADLGDTRCGVDLEALRISGTVDSSTNKRNFLATLTAKPVDWFKYGVVTWVTGLNAGLSMEVKGNPVAGTFELALAMPFAIVATDTFTVTPGCNKLLKTGPEEYLGDCKVKYDNVPNFRAWPEVPGPGVLTKVGGQ